MQLPTKRANARGGEKVAVTQQRVLGLFGGRCWLYSREN